MRMTLLLSTALVLAASSSSACAQRELSDEQRQKILERWQAADRNGDGVIDRAEAEAGLPRIYRNFDKLDTDGDGRLTPEELRAAAARFGERRR
jgi:Ca2+-binding EF-hand superfamily protein